MLLRKPHRSAKFALAVQCEDSDTGTVWQAFPQGLKHTIIMLPGCRG